MRTRVLTVCAGLGLSVGAIAQSYDVAMLEIEGAPLARAAGMALFGDAGLAFPDYLDALHGAADDRSLEAVIVRLKDASLQTTQIEELSQAIAAVRDAGKRVTVFAEGYDTAGLLLGAHADEVLIQQGGGVMLPGLYMEEMYLADTLKWAGLDADFVQVGDYKGANEMYMNAQPSEAWDQNISGLLDSMYAEVRATLKEGRGLTDAELDEAMRRCWMADGATAVEVGLIDGQVDLTELLDHVEQTARAGGWSGGELVYQGDLIADSESEMDFSNPFLMLSQLFEPPQRFTSGPTIAVLHIDGAIMDGDSSPGGPLSSASVGSRSIRNAIKDIAKDDNIGGVVVRIDSPGGSAIASEIIWQGLDRLAEDKPVWVSVGSMAASGGYYIAVGGEKIYVNPSSIVGSIGVVGGKISFAGLLDRVDANIVGRSRGPMAGMFGMVNGWDESELAAVREKMTETYELFTSRVSAGRPGIDLSKTAEGRLFLGDDAVRLNMADELGSLDDALDDLAGTLGYEEFDVMDFPPPPSLDEMIEQALGGFISAPGVDSPAGLPASLAGLRTLLGAERFDMLKQAVSVAVMLRQEPVLLTMPRIMTIE